jgi:nitroreductase
MELMELIARRQSIRRYVEGDVPTADIERMIEAARLAPSGKNIQNWHYIAITNKGLIRRVADAVLAENERICLEMDKKDETRGGRFRVFAKRFTVFFTEAPLLIVVMSRQYEPSGYLEMRFADLDSDWLIHEKNPGMQSLGASIEHLYLRAIELGYGLCWLTSANYADAAIAELMRAEAGFDRPGWFVAALLSVGRPMGDQKSPPKKGVGEVLTLIE